MALRTTIDVRLAQNEDGIAIAALIKEMGFAGIQDLDWSDIYPYWLVAEMDGEIVGAVERDHHLAVRRRQERTCGDA